MGNAAKRTGIVLLLLILLLTSVVSTGLASPAESDSRRSTASFELEPNNVTGKADWLFAGKDAYGKIGTSGDVDFWKIKAPAQGTLNVWLGDLPDGQNYDLYLYDDKERLLGQSERSGSAEESVKGIAAEKSTWYYVKVAGSGNDADRKNYYHLRAEFLPSTVEGKPDAYEPNNTAGNSYHMENGGTIEGTLHNTEDVDYYRIDVKLASTIEVNLRNLPENMDLDLYLYDKNQKQIAKSERAKNADETITYNGDPGTYYVKVSRDRHSPVKPNPYKLGVQVNTIPVILIPGIGGSRLQVRENGKVSEVWLGDSLITDLMTKEYKRVLSLRPSAQGSVRVVPQTEGIEVFADATDEGFHAIEYLSSDKNLKSYTEQYYSMVQHLQKMGYQKHESLFAFPYDWRFSNSDNAKRLKNKIDEALAKSQAKQVQIVAHSMGGILVKETLLQNPSYQQKTKRIIYMGTPFLGSPRAYQAIKFGYNFGIPFFSDIGNSISEYSPSVYELLPSKRYVEIQPFLLLSSQMRNVPFTYQDFLTDERIRLDYQPLVRFSGNQHEKWDLRKLNVSQYVIVGEGHTTLLGYRYEANHKQLFPYFDKANGDGTVPFVSADYGLQDISKRFYITEKHANLPSNPFVIQQVAHLLLGIDSVQPGLHPTPQKSHPYNYYLIYRKDGKFPDVSVKESVSAFNLREKTGEDLNNLLIEHHGNIVIVHAPPGEQLSFHSGKEIRAFGGTQTIIQHFSSESSKLDKHTSQSFQLQGDRLVEVPIDGE